MLKILITRFWPVLLPLALYLVWLAHARRKAGKSGEEKPGFFDGPWWLPTMASLGLVIVAFLWLGFSQEPVNGIYIPAHVEDGRLVPAQTIPRPKE